MVIEVHSPQFRDERRYVYRWGSTVAEASLELLAPRSRGAAPAANRYIEGPLLYCLTLLRHRHAASGGAVGGAAFFEDAAERA